MTGPAGGESKGARRGGGRGEGLVGVGKGMTKGVDASDVWGDRTCSSFFSFFSLDYHCFNDFSTFDCYL